MNKEEFTARVGMLGGTVTFLDSDAGTHIRVKVPQLNRGLRLTCRATEGPAIWDNFWEVLMSRIEREDD